MRYTVWGLVFIMILPSSYLAYSLYREQQFKKSTDAFIDNEFVNKGYTVVYKKTNFNSSPKIIELAMLSKRFTSAQIDSLQSKVNSIQYLKDTRLVIRQDSTDRFNALKGDILKQIKGSENEVNQKDVKIMQLEKELAKNSFDNKKLFQEATALFPQILSLSVANHDFAMQKDSAAHATAVLYTSKAALDKEDIEKLTNWLNKRLSVKDIQILRAE